MIWKKMCAMNLKVVQLSQRLAMSCSLFAHIQINTIGLETARKLFIYAKMKLILD